MSAKNRKNIFSVINFVNTKNDKKSIDCVPSTWISYNPESQGLVTRFMPPPYSKKKCKALHELVKRNEPPLDKWPTYPIKILANTGKVI